MKKDNSISKKQLDRKKEKEGIAGDISTQGRVQIRRSSLNIGWAMKVEKNKSAYIIKDVSPEEWREEYRNFESALTFKA